MCPAGFDEVPFTVAKSSKVGLTVATEDADVLVSICIEQNRDANCCCVYILAIWVIPVSSNTLAVVLVLSIDSAHRLSNSYDYAKRYSWDEIMPLVKTRHR